MRRGDRFRYIPPHPRRIVDEVQRLHRALCGSSLGRGQMLLSFQGTSGRQGRQVRMTFRLGETMGDLATAPPEPDWAGLEQAAAALCESIQRSGDTATVLDVILDARGPLSWSYQPGEVIAGGRAPRL